MKVTSLSSRAEGERSNWSIFLYWFDLPIISTDTVGWFPILYRPIVSVSFKKVLILYPPIFLGGLKLRFLCQAIFGFKLRFLYRSIVLVIV